MTLPRITRFAASTVMALGLCLPLGLALAPLAASAQDQGPHFRAQLASPAVQERTIAGGVVWRCADTTCTAPHSGTRPLRMCRDLQREMGQIVSFEVGGIALPAEDLARCNG
jgi:hypothetical protein